MKAEIIINGPKGFAHAEIPVPIDDFGLNMAFICVKQLYEELPDPDVSTKENSLEDLRHLPRRNTATLGSKPKTG